MHLKVKSMLRTLCPSFMVIAQDHPELKVTSQPPIQNLAKMTLNKLDYSNYVQ